jgi:hypothetical protein
MIREYCMEAAVCTAYERLLEECDNALTAWNEQGAAVCESRVSGRKIGDELLRLQAKYAKAYTVLQNHTKDCPQCEMLSRVAGGTSRIERSDSERQFESVL